MLRCVVALSGQWWQKQVRAETAQILGKSAPWQRCSQISRKEDTYMMQKKRLVDVDSNRQNNELGLC